MRVWIVELFNSQTGRWEPTVGVGLNRDDARREFWNWKDNNPNDKFRIRLYVRKREPKGKT